MATKLELRVGNLDCEHDAAAIERGLTNFPGLNELKVYPKAAKVSLAFNPEATTPKALKEKLETLGFPPQDGLTMPEQPKPWHNPKVLTSAVSGILLLVGWLLVMSVGHWAARRLNGGLTGDVYGALCELTELVTLLGLSLL